MLVSSLNRDLKNNMEQAERTSRLYSVNFWAKLQAKVDKKILGFLPVFWIFHAFFF